MIVVYGQVGSGPVMRRVVGVGVFMEVWRRFARPILSATRERPYTVGDKRVWVDLHEPVR